MKSLQTGNQWYATKTDWQINPYTKVFELKCYQYNKSIEISLCDTDGIIHFIQRTYIPNHKTVEMKEVGSPKVKVKPFKLLY